MNGNWLVSLLQKPAVLMIGHRFLGRNTAENPLFSAYANLSQGKGLYPGWLEDPTPLSHRSDILLASSGKVVVNDYLLSMMQIKWRGVYTTCIDNVPRRLLEIPDVRVVLPITTPGTGIQPGKQLPLFCLFGAAGRPELPPSGPADMPIRRRTALRILDTLPETLTPSGVLLVEGWSPTSDWLRPRDFAGVLQGMLPGQVVLFGMGPEDQQVLQDDDDFNLLIEQNTIQMEPLTLQECIAQLMRDGQFENTLLASSAEAECLYKVLRCLPDADQPAAAPDLVEVPISKLELDRLTSTFQILQPLNSTQPLPPNLEEQYDLFREFLGNAFNTIPWQWIEQLAFHRPTVQDFIDKALRVANSPSPQDKTILLYGQAGSGKTVALQILCLTLRKHGFAVMYTPPGLLAPELTQVDTFCQTLEAAGSGAPAFLVVDATTKAEDYLVMSNYFASRGRKVIVVGSAYTFHRPQKQERQRGEGKRSLIDHILPIFLNEAEQRQILNYLAKFIPDIPAFVKKIDNADLSNLFALLYYLLPPTRGPLANQLLQEILVGSEQAQASIIAAQQETTQVSGLSLMAQRLQDALERVQTDLSCKVDEVEEKTSVNAAALRQLLNTVMLTSRLGLPLPQSLALRLLFNDNRVYSQLLKTDIIVETQLNEGQFQLSARHTLEAKIWIARKVPNSKDQLALIQAVIMKAEDVELFEDGVVLDFVVKLLQSVGPQAQNEFQLSQHFADLAQIVYELKARNRNLHPRILLFQSNVIRESIKAQQGKTCSIPQQDLLESWLLRLTEAEESISQAEDLIKRNPDGRLSSAGRRMMASMATERACVLGTKLVCLEKALTPEVSLATNWQTQANQFFARARAAWLQSLEYEDVNYYATNVACWISQSRCNLAGLSPEQEAVILADWGEMLDRSMDLDMAPTQMDKREGLEAAYAHQLGDYSRFSEILAKSESRGSYAVRALSARYQWKNLGAAAARAYLEDQCQNIILTERAILVLYAKLWWESETGYTEYFPHERICLPFSLPQWTQWAEINNALMRCEGERDGGRAIFFSAIAALHLNRSQEATTLFQNLDRLNVGGYRRARSLFLLTDAKGTPIRFTAEFQGRRKNQDLLVWCEDLNSHLPLNAIEHGLNAALRPGQILGPFHVSLNYRGFYAEPLRRYQPNRS